MRVNPLQQQTKNTSITNQTPINLKIINALHHPSPTKNRFLKIFFKSPDPVDTGLSLPLRCFVWSTTS